MSTVPCDLFQALLEDLAENPQDPALARLEPAERKALRVHVNGCRVCLHGVDHIDYPADEGLADDMLNEVVGFLAGSEDEPLDEETKDLINAHPALHPGRWGMNLGTDAWELKVARQAARVQPRDYEKQLDITARLISRGESDRNAVSRAAIRLAWIREAWRIDPRYINWREEV